MTKEITINNKPITYTLRKSSRARRMRLAVFCDGSVAVILPYGYHESFAERFILEKTRWLVSKITFFQQFANQPITRRSNEDYLKYKDEAKEVVEKIAKRLSTDFGFRYNTVKIKNQKTCWGSCSRKGNLNFNYKILFLPKKTQEYIVAHELCHLREFNHSKKFWNWVSQVVPDYFVVKRELRQSGLNYF